MKKETQFLYDALNAHINLLGLTHIHLQGYSYSREGDRKFTHLSFAAHCDSHGPSDIKVDAPDYISMASAYRALLELEDAFGIRHNVTTQWVADAIGRDGLLKALGEIT